ncbi:MAG: hypothetical protein EBX52_00725 [Proteobacteria bacterium]|nr:hypothetical protein [Pseudomonadota bacterium]
MVVAPGFGLTGLAALGAENVTDLEEKYRAYATDLENIKKEYADVNSRATYFLAEKTKAASAAQSAATLAAAAKKSATTAEGAYTKLKKALGTAEEASKKAWSAYEKGSTDLKNSVSVAEKGLNDAKTALESASKDASYAKQKAADLAVNSGKAAENAKNLADQAASAKKIFDSATSSSTKALAALKAAKEVVTKAQAALDGNKDKSKFEALGKTLSNAKGAVEVAQKASDQAAIDLASAKETWGGLSSKSSDAAAYAKSTSADASSASKASDALAKAYTKVLDTTTKAEKALSAANDASVKGSAKLASALDVANKTLESTRSALESAWAVYQSEQDKATSMGTLADLAAARVLEASSRYDNFKNYLASLNSKAKEGSRRESLARCSDHPSRDGAHGCRQRVQCHVGLHAKTELEPGTESEKLRRPPAHVQRDQYPSRDISRCDHDQPLLRRKNHHLPHWFGSPLQVFRFRDRRSVLPLPPGLQPSARCTPVERRNAHRDHELGARDFIRVLRRWHTASGPDRFQQFE